MARPAARPRAASQRTSVATHMAWIPDEWSLAAEHVMRALGDRVPSRTLLLHPEPGSGVDGFDASIVVERFSGGRTGVCAEIVRIRLRGSAAEAPASVVVPLQLPDLPVFLRWRGRPPFGRRPFEQLIGVTDRLIVDSREWDRLPSGLAKLAEWFDRVAVSDLAWARMLPWRASLADRWPGIKRAKRLSCRRPPCRRGAAARLAGDAAAAALPAEPRRRRKGVARRGRRRGGAARARAPVLARRPALGRARVVRARPRVRGGRPSGVT